MKVFKNARIFDGDNIIEGQNVLVDGKVIIGISEETPEGSEVVDCGGGILAPGLIDLQIYGGGGHLFASSLSIDALFAIAEDLVKKGTTGFLITIPTNSFDVYQKAVDIVKDNPHPAVLGLNLEGPYINPVKRGAHQEKFIKKPDFDEIQHLLDFAGGVVKMMTLAPEICDDELLEMLQRYKVILSAGHSNATFEQAMHGFKTGIRAVTHLFNAMSPMLHRAPGLPGAAFDYGLAYASIIPDGVHVAFEIAKISKKLLDDRLFFITDAVTETKEGPYVYVRKDDRFELPDGTLAGSVLTMPAAVKNGVEKMGLSLEESLRMASLYPAKALKLSRVGRIRTGFKANLVCLTAALELNFNVLEGAVVAKG